MTLLYNKNALNLCALSRTESTMQRIDLNKNWSLMLDGKSFDVDLPHTWNNLDGQDGANGYLRTKGVYTKTLDAVSGVCYLEVLAANSVAEVELNGEKLCRHEGGYSAFWVELTGKLNAPAKLRISVDNSPSDAVYPTMADFTFYGGLYRGVNMIVLPEKHFIPTSNGLGVWATAYKKEGYWELEIEYKVSQNALNDEIAFSLTDADGKETGFIKALGADGKAVMKVTDPRLWDVRDPYLYKLVAAIPGGDSVSLETAFRYFSVDADKGFFLNGRHLKLKGVSRHQDREGVGNALTPEMHEEDIRLIKEVGANSVRLAHYQHSDYFYTLCDREGLLVWAEVPVISRFSKKRQENAVSQLKELILQAKNHPSIFAWSISNEITIAGESKGLKKALEELNALSKSLDPSRPTVMAQVTMCPANSELNSITDLIGYNHYFGWYVGTFRDLDNWLANWRKTAPDKKLCLSEYGAEGIVRYQNSSPVPGDYSESYQAVYHENYIERIAAADWMWGSYVWNMFDFGSAARNEGGVRGRNNKGLVTFDRKIKKDAFYVYKAYWSDEPFVKIAGERYLKRKIGESEIKVYSNGGSVRLEVGDYCETIEGAHVFRFAGVPILPGKNVIKAFSGGEADVLEIEGVAEEPREYRMPDGAGSFVRNWFASDSDEIDPTRFSTADKVGDLLKNAEVQSLIKKFIGNKVPAFLLALVKPFRVRTLLKLPFVKLDEQMVGMVDRYLQTIKK